MAVEKQFEIEECGRGYGADAGDVAGGGNEDESDVRG